MVTMFPTLVIGVGGTGKSALWDLRARVQAHFGSFRKIPMIGYLALDTDAAMDKELGGTGLLGQSMNFGASEHLHLTVSEQQMKDIKQNLEVHYPYLADWVEKDALRHSAVVAGAGTVRQIGRLALHMNLNRVKEALGAALKGVTSADALKQTSDYLKEIGITDAKLERAPLKIFVVGSLIGGTGSGMFLDIAYLLREDSVKASISHANPSTTGIMVLPLASVQRDGIDTRGSAYSALVELNHFADPNTEYQVRYPDGTSFRSTEPPFDFTFLSTLQSEEVNLDNGRRLVEMIGQRLFLEATCSFSEKITSNRDNIIKYMGELDGRRCNQYFLSFGLSTLEIPVRAISSACGARFMGEVVQDLRAGKYAGQKEELKIDPSFLQGFLTQHGLSEEKIRETLLGEIEKEIRDSFAGCSELSSKSVAAQLVKLEQEIEKDTTPRQGEGGVDGRLVQRVEENTRHECERCEARLTRLVTDLTQRPDGRLLYASKFLDVLKQHFEGVKQANQQKAEALKKREQMGKLAVARNRAELAEIASDWLLNLSPWQKSAYRDAFEQRYSRDVLAWSRLRLDRVLLRNEGLLGYLDRLLQALEELRRRTLALDDHLARMEQTFDSLAVEAKHSYNPVNGRLVYALGNEEQGADGVVEQTYQKILGNPVQKRQRLESFFNDRVRPLLTDKSGQVNIFLLQKEAVATAELSERLWRDASKCISEWGNLNQMKVLDAFFQETNFEADFREVLRRSAPFLKVDRHAPHYEDSSGKEQAMVAYFGAGSSGTASERRFLEMCQDRIAGLKGEEPRKLIVMDDPSQVIFYREYGAFPMRLWTHLPTMQQVYEQQLQKSTMPLHLFHKGFPYIPIVKAAPEDLDRMVTLFLVASMPGMNILQSVVVGREQKLRLDFHDPRGKRHVLDLEGRLPNIGDRLLERENQPAVERLEREVRRRWEEEGDETFAAWLRALQNSFWETVPDEEERKWQQGLLEAYLCKNRLDQVAVTGQQVRAATPAAPPQASAPPPQVTPPPPSPGLLPPTAALPRDLAVSLRPDGSPRVPTNGGAAREEQAMAAAQTAAQVADPSPAQKQCTACGAMVNASARICMHCRWDFEKGDFFKPGS